MSKSKQVSFKGKESDLLEFVEDKDFSYYVKNLIRKDMNNSEIPKSLKEEEPKPRRNANFEI